MRKLFYALCMLTSIFTYAQTEVYINDLISVSYENILVSEGKNNTQYNCIQSVTNKTNTDLYYEHIGGVGSLVAEGFIELKILNATGWNAALSIGLPESEFTTGNGLNALRVLRAGETFTKENLFKVANGIDPQIKAYPSKQLQDLSAFTVDLNSKLMDGQWSSSDGQKMLMTYSLESIQTDINSKILNWSLSSSNDVTSSYTNTQNPNARLLLNKATKTVTIESGVGLVANFKK
ncbi:hypothetical protein N9B83_03220 [Schleiferiaceae bacterium]|nr:hypothetical protein [Schleiferiaceae bacterium]